MITETEIWKPLPFDLVKLEKTPTPKKGDTIIYDGEKWITTNINILIEKYLSEKSNS